MNTQTSSFLFGVSSATAAVQSPRGDGNFSLCSSYICSEGLKTSSYSVYNWICINTATNLFLDFRNDVNPCEPRNPSILSFSFKD